MKNLFLLLLVLFFMNETTSAQKFAENTVSGSPPATPVRPVTDDYFGVKVVDPYRWLENLKDPEVVSWIKAQHNYARSFLDNIPCRKELLSRITELNSGFISVRRAQQAGNYYFYLKFPPGEDFRKFYMYDIKSKKETLLVDPTKISSGEPYTVDAIFPSPNGKYVAYYVSKGGSEQRTIHIIDTANGKQLNEKLEGARYTLLNWQPDGKSFFYNRQPKDDKGNFTKTKKRVYRHQVGTEQEKDVAVFGYKVSDKIDSGIDDTFEVLMSPTSPYAVIIAAHGVDNNFDLYVALLSEVKDEKTPWKHIAGGKDKVTFVQVNGNHVYMMSSKDAPHFQVLRMDLRNPNIEKAEVVVPQSDKILRGIYPAKDALYVEQLDAGIGKLLRVSYSDLQKQNIKMPFNGAINEFSTNPFLDGALVRMTGWTQSPRYYRLEKNEMKDTELIPPATVNFSNIATTRIEVKSADGTLVPLTILHKKDIRLDGTSPALLEAYGAYGFSYNPAYEPKRLAWLERGGIYAVAHIRGGGEKGTEWHEGGRLKNKSKGVDDFIACAEHLINEKYTSANRLAITGGSAGGVIMGLAITRKPKLFAAAVVDAGKFNPLRQKADPNGPANIPEYGDIDTEEGMKILLASDSLHHIKDGDPYPAVLLFVGANDARVAPWNSAKMAARLQTATSSKKPILMNTDFGAGHGIGTSGSKKEAEEKFADFYSFLFWQSGICNSK